MISYHHSYIPNRLKRNLKKRETELLDSSSLGVWLKSNYLITQIKVATDHTWIKGNKTGLSTSGGGVHVQF